MDKLKRIFKVIKDDFHDNVPPLTEVINEEHHYELCGIYQGKKTFFGKVIMHEKTVEIAFYPHISRETEWTLYPGDIFKRMENRFDAEIEDLSPELQANIEEVISNMIDYFRMEKVLDPDTEFDA